MKLPRGDLEDYFLIVIFIIGLLLILFILNSCAAQSKQFKANYRYTTVCEFMLTGNENQQGGHVSAGADIDGEVCRIRRESTADEKEKGPPE